MQLYQSNNKKLYIAVFIIYIIYMICIKNNYLLIKNDADIYYKFLYQFISTFFFFSIFHIFNNEYKI